MPRLTDNLEQRMRAYDGTYHTFKSILDSAHWYEKILLGEKFTLWRLACLHNFLVNPSCHTDLDYISPEIIGEFTEKYAEVRNMPDGPRRQELWELIAWSAPKSDNSEGIMV